jgi:hypothetical protein
MTDITRIPADDSHGAFPGMSTSDITDIGISIERGRTVTERLQHAIDTGISNTAHARPCFGKAGGAQ